MHAQAAPVRRDECQVAERVGVEVARDARLQRVPPEQEGLRGEQVGVGGVGRRVRRSPDRSAITPRWPARRLGCARDAAAWQAVPAAVRCDCTVPAASLPRLLPWERATAQMQPAGREPRGVRPTGATWGLGHPTRLLTGKPSILRHPDAAVGPRPWLGPHRSYNALHPVGWELRCVKGRCAATY